MDRKTQLEELSTKLPLELVDLKQFARAVGRSTRTLKRYKRAGKLPTPRKHMGKQAYWTWDQVKAWVKEPQELGHGLPEGGNKSPKPHGGTKDASESREGQEGPKSS